MELVLVDNAGLTLRDLRGRSETRTRTVEPAAIERALDGAGPGGRAQAALLIAGLTSAAALSSPALLAAGACAAAAARWAAGFEAGPRREVETVEEPGMTDEEVHRFAVLHDERERMREEEMEDQFNDG